MTEDMDAQELLSSVKTQSKRLKSLADEGDLDGVFVMRELHGTVLPLIGDVLVLVDRLEEHAEWASQSIGALGGDGDDTASQLVAADADKLEAFARGVQDIVRASLRDVDAESEQAKKLSALDTLATEVLALVDDVRIADEHDEPDDDVEGAPAPANGSG